ncbi:MAG: hypothetical protein GY839_05315, partial [candidate division Zixibacteria bacterium]|nr:hypothetical protein [candidate division Zixibacteria bacterium]
MIFDKKVTVKPKPKLDSEISKFGKEYHRQYRRAARAAERNIILDDPVDIKRRRKAERNPEYFCRTYAPHVFYNPFCKDQKDIVESILACVENSTFQYVLAERGGGKSQIARFIGGVYAIVTGRVKWFVYLGASQTEADNGVQDIMAHYELEDSLLRADYPEVCQLVHALGGAPQAGGGQTVGGKRTRIKWSPKRVLFPIVNGSKASGAIISPRGIDGAIRGLSFQGKRPDLILGDDLDTEESAVSTVQTDKRKSVLTNSVLNLSGPNTGLPVILLGTKISHNCLIAQISDPKIFPGWTGIKQKRMYKPPDAAELWDKYIYVRQSGKANGEDPHGRKAHDFYLANRKQMDKGAKISNKLRYRNITLLDGSQQESSAIEAFYNEVADKGWEVVNGEYQNEPPETEQDAHVLEVNQVAESLNGYQRGVIPPGCKALTRFIDVHNRDLVWIDIAWKCGLIGYVVDYGVVLTNLPSKTSITEKEYNSQIELAIIDTLEYMKEAEQEGGYPYADTGVVKHIDLCLVDSGDGVIHTDAVYKFCSGAVKYMASKGLAPWRNPRVKNGVRNRG